MKILWDSCLMCHTPINLNYTNVCPLEQLVYSLHIDQTWAHSNLIITDMWRYKRFGKRWVKVCAECFGRKIKVTQKQIHQREVGALKFQTPHPSGWTDAEFRSWLELLRVRYNYTVKHELQSSEVDPR